MKDPRGVLVLVGEASADVDAAKVVRVHVDSLERSDVVDAVRDCGLSSSDVRTTVVVVLSGAQPQDLAAYAALCGFVGRRLPVIVAGTRVAPHQVSQMARAALASVPEDGARGVIQVGLQHPGLDCFSFGPHALAAARVAKRVRFVPPNDPVQTFVQFLALATVRERDGVERLPFLSTGSEPVTDDPKQVAGIDLDGMRRAALSMRRSTRSDDRTAVVEPAGISERDARLVEAASVDVETILGQLGAQRTDVVEEGVHAIWSCPRVRAHTDIPATAALRVFEGNRVHCARCDVEKIDPVRLVMTARRMSADEAADLILSD